MGVGPGNRRAPPLRGVRSLGYGTRRGVAERRRRLSRAGDPGNAGDHRGSVFLTDQHVVQPEAQRAFRQVRCLPQECEHLLVAVVATYRATHPDQSPLENNLVHLIRAGDGRVSESWFHSRIQYEVDEFWVP